MASFPYRSRLSFLAATLDDHKDKVVRLLARIRGALADSPLAAMNPLKFRRFMAMMREVADAQDEERRILSRIEDVETQHRIARHNKQLLQADDNFADPLDPSPEHAAAKRPKGSLEWLAAFWLLFLREDNNAK